MRLVDTATVRIHDYLPGNEPPYAILSHTWGESEITYQEMLAADGRTETTRFEKIVRCCEQAHSMQQAHIWIDTCCIDKTNNVELSEAINSMYRWYEEAEVCLVYLSDVYSAASNESDFQMPESRWFHRGWTLQELLAPTLKIFFNSTWDRIGYSRKTWDPATIHPQPPSTHPLLEGLRPKLPRVTESLAALTKIPAPILYGDHLMKYSIAEKMSWAANRETTRKEDEAYSLLGIFGVNMPLLYGEGVQAFRRLQEEILKTSDDQSIFAHVITQEETSLASPFAPSPSCFRLSGDIGEFRDSASQPQDVIERTKKGLRLRCHTCSLAMSTARIAFLGCIVGRSSIARPALILEPSAGRYVRSHPSLLLIVTSNTDGESTVSWRGRMDYGTYLNIIHPKNTLDETKSETIELVTRRINDMTLPTLPSIRLAELPAELALTSVEPENRWDDKQKTFLSAHSSAGAQALFQFNVVGEEISFRLIVGEGISGTGTKDPIIEPWCDTSGAASVRLFQDYLYNQPSRYDAKPGSAFPLQYSHDSNLSNEYSSNVKLLSVLGRQEIILKVVKIPGQNVSTVEPLAIDPSDESSELPPREESVPPLVLHMPPT